MNWTPLVRAGWVGLVVRFSTQIFMGYGIALALDSSVFDWHQDRVGVSLWGSPDFGPEVAAYRHWIQALLGGTFSSWAVAMLALTWIPMRRGERWAWWTIVASLLSWFWVDTWRSFADGVWVNVAFNLCGLLIPMALLALVWPGLPRSSPTAREAG